MWHRVHGDIKTCDGCREISETWVLLIGGKAQIRAMICPACHRQVAELLRRSSIAPDQTAQGTDGDTRGRGLVPRLKEA